MPQFIEYLIRLSGTVMAMYLFYWLVLSRLTFYTANRWYLLGYSIIAFFIPLININPLLENSSLYNYEVVQWIPVVETSALNNSDAAPGKSFQWNSLNVILVTFCTGALLMFVRLFLQYFSV